MSDILERILADKREHVRQKKALLSQAEIDARAKQTPSPRGFAAALDEAVAQGGYGLIAEIKKASPSAGLIRPDFEPGTLARAYRTGGAACLSVLTDEPWFQGRDAYLAEARDAAPMPALRKDFMIDPWQIAESRALGADAVLLIMAALSDAQAAEMEDCARRFGMDVLVEVHDEAEFDRALALASPLIGVNNRNLKTMITDVATTERLAGRLPAGRVLVAESGLKSASDLARLAKAGARRFLIGETLMRQADVAAATQALLASPFPA